MSEGGSEVPIEAFVVNSGMVSSMNLTAAKKELL